MPKKVSEKEKEAIIADFLNGKSINQLSENFNCSKITISRHLKKNISEKKYKEISKKNNLNNDSLKGSSELNKSDKNKSQKVIKKDDSILEDSFYESSFIEITPLDYDIDNEPQKDLSSLPIAEADFPNVVYMIVDKNIELETKYLKEYPEWDFLSNEELDRKTIEIFLDLKAAKRVCNNQQKVIKVPNTNVFKLAGPFLLAKGISRIVSPDKLIAL